MASNQEERFLAGIEFDRKCFVRCVNDNVDGFSDEKEELYDHEGGNADKDFDDITDMLPSDPFNMEISTKGKCVAASTSWLEDFEKDSGFNADEPKVSGELDFLMAGAMRIHQDRGFQLIDGNHDLFRMNFKEGLDRGHGKTNCDVVGGGPSDALLLALGYLRLRDLLAVESVCKSLRDAVRGDPLLWKSIHIDYPFIFKITDSTLIKLKNRAQGHLHTLSLYNCSKITNVGLIHVLERNPSLTKEETYREKQVCRVVVEPTILHGGEYLPRSPNFSTRSVSLKCGCQTKCMVIQDKNRSHHMDWQLPKWDKERMSAKMVWSFSSQGTSYLCSFLISCLPVVMQLNVPGCLRLTIDGILSNLKVLKAAGKTRLKYLGICGLFGETNQHIEEIKLLTGADNSKLPTTHKLQFFSGDQLRVTSDNDRAVDIEVCPKCQQLKLVYDCPQESCQKKQSATQLCRACTTCIARCFDCGCCLNNCDYKELSSFELICLDCLRKLRGCQEKEQKMTNLKKTTVAENDQF